MIESPTVGILGLGGPELVIIMAVLAAAVAFVIVLIIMLGKRRSGPLPKTCPHCGKDIQG